MQIVQDYFYAKGFATAEKFFWKNSVAAYKWVRREYAQPPSAAMQNQTLALVTPQNVTTPLSQISLDASASSSASGRLMYMYSAATGGLTPAILQTPTSPNATIQFVMGPGTVQTHVDRQGRERENIDCADYIDLQTVRVAPTRPAL